MKACESAINSFCKIVRFVGAIAQEAQVERLDMGLSDQVNQAECIEQFKVCLVAKGFLQKFGINL